MERDGQVLAMDSRPSDALALALRVDCPIYVEDEVMERSRTRYRSERKSVERGPAQLAGEVETTRIWAVTRCSVWQGRPGKRQLTIHRTNGLVAFFACSRAGRLVKWAYSLHARGIGLHIWARRPPGEARGTSSDLRNRHCESEGRSRQNHHLHQPRRCTSSQEKENSPHSFRRIHSPMPPWRFSIRAKLDHHVATSSPNIQ